MGGNVFLEKKAFPRIRSGLPPQTSKAFAVGKEESSGVSKFSPEAETKDTELASLPMGGNVFFGEKSISTYSLRAPARNQPQVFRVGRGRAAEGKDTELRILLQPSEAGAKGKGGTRERTEV